MLTFLAIAQRYRPKWLVWENVPGVLSSNRGRDFGTFLGALGELGYGFAYRVLDAQWFGVAQRRRRVFVVGYFGDWQRPAKVLFESESVCRNTTPSRETGQKVARTIAESFGNIGEKCVRLPTYGIPGNWIGRQPQNGGNAVEPMHNISPCLTKTDRHGVVQPYVGGVDYENNAHTMDEPTGPLLKGSPTGGGRPLPAIATAMQVRRLTPTECERLQGFPDNYTDISWRNKLESPDGLRYRAMGNSMAVPVMRWIGQRISNANGC
jgi:DNA (cytosine-5)-methyltransferase 1